MEEQITGLRAAVAVCADHVAAAGLDAAVPTCPRWTTRTLLAHQGMVHRWAAANLRGEESHPPDWNAEGRRVADPVAWLQEGAEELIATIRSVPDDVAAMTFLKDAPAARLFWARRQCHETTIHAVDALAARLGRFPTPEDTTITDAVALDGIDEVLTGFIPRGTSRFEGVDPVRVAIQPTGSHRAWTVLIQGGAATTSRKELATAETAATVGASVPARTQGPVAEARLEGSPVALYLTLWNRTTDDVVTDPAGFLPMWRDRVRVRWS